MTNQNDILTGDPNLYTLIAKILTFSLVVNAVLLFLLNVHFVTEFLDKIVGDRRAFFVQLFFWGTSGATIAGSIFMANDKDINELERKKERPDPMELRYPNRIDVWLYVQHILSGGFLALLGAAILFTGLGYFEVSIEHTTAKHKIFLIVFCFLIGLYEKKFLGTLEGMSKKIFQKHAA